MDRTEIETPDARQQAVDVDVSRLDKLIGAVDQKVNDAADTMLDILTERLSDYAVPDRSIVERVNGKGETLVSVTGRSPRDVLYRRLSPELREWRNEDSDHYMAEWMRGVIYRDRPKFLQAAEKLEGMFGRATTLEGTADTGGGIGSGTGAELLPHPLSQVVMIARDKVAKFRRFATNVTMTTQTLQVPTAAAFTAATVAEGSVAAQGEPTIASQLLTAFKIQCQARASVEMVADSAFNLVGIYATRAGGAIGALEDVEIATAAGTPTVTAAVAGGNVDEATTTVLIYEDLVKLYFALQQEYRPMAAWFGNSVTLTLLATLMDGNDRPILMDNAARPGIQADDSIDGILFRKAVYEVPLADGQLIFGDLSGYTIGTRAGITFAASDHVGFSSDLVHFKWTARMDGAITDAVAMKQMSALATVA